MLDNKKIEALKYQPVDTNINASNAVLQVMKTNVHNNSINSEDTETVDFSFSKTYGDRIFDGSGKYQNSCITTLLEREKTHDDYGNITDNTYHSNDEVVNALDQLEKVYQDYPNFTYYNQNLYTESYGDSNLQISGCCPTSFAMVASYLLGKNVLPTEVSSGFEKYYYSGAGTDVTGNCFYDLSSQYHLGTHMISWNSTDDLVGKIAFELNSHHPIILNVGAGNFTSAGHFIVLLGLDQSGNVIVADPNSVSNSIKTYSLQSLANQTKRIASSVWAFQRVPSGV